MASVFSDADLLMWRDREDGAHAPCCGAGFPCASPNWSVFYDGQRKRERAEAARAAPADADYRRAVRREGMTRAQLDAEETRNGILFAFAGAFLIFFCVIVVWVLVAWHLS